MLELAIKGQAALVLVVKKQWCEVQHFREGKARPYRTPVPAKAHQTHVTTAPPHGCQLYPAVHRGRGRGQGKASCRLGTIKTAESLIENFLATF